MRFVQLFNGAYAMGEGVGNWDGHKTLKEQYACTRRFSISRPPRCSRTSRRGACSTTRWWFGRPSSAACPRSRSGANGRDHNPKGFTVWLAGAGVKRATSYGATDEFGYQAVENPSSVYELHATMLHLLGLDHQRLSYYHNGTEQRLTFVHGRVIEDVLA